MNLTIFNFSANEIEFTLIRFFATHTHKYMTSFVVKNDNNIILLHANFLHFPLVHS